MCESVADTSFKTEIKKWRGKRLQKEAADILGVCVRTYEGWEAGVHVPSGAKCMKCIREKMYGTAKN